MINMRKLSFEETKKLELGILKTVTSFCEENGIRYFLAYGTLIGAARHKGFIPWDDDIDLQMPRPDYEKFMSLYNEKNDASPYRALLPLKDGSRHTFLKVVDTRTAKVEKGMHYEDGKAPGIDIDIFPIDGQPEDDREYEKYYKKKNRIFREIYELVGTYSWKRKLLYLFPRIHAHILGKEKLFAKIEKINAPYPYEEAKMVGATNSLYNGIKNRTEKKNYESHVLLEFEGEMFRAPVGYHEILSSFYGDYMILPPPEKQVTHHKNETYWRNENEEI